MNKKAIIGICTVFFLSTGFMMNNNVIDVKTENNEATHTIISEGDFTKHYEDYAGLISDAEIIAYGTVGKVEVFSDEHHHIMSRFDFNIENILKGDVADNTMKVLSEGGIMPYSDFLEQNKEYFQAKLTLEGYDEEVTRAVSEDETIERVWYGLDQVKEGSDLLLFMTRSTLQEDEYFILGTSYFGELQYDKTDKSFFRVKHSLDDKRARSIGIELEANLDQLIELVEENK